MTTNLVPTNAAANTVTFTINDEVAPLSIPDDVPEFHKKEKKKNGGGGGDQADSDIGPAYTVVADAHKNNKYSQQQFKPKWTAKPLYPRGGSPQGNYMETAKWTCGGSSRSQYVTGGNWYLVIALLR